MNDKKEYERGLAYAAATYLFKDQEQFDEYMRSEKEKALREFASDINASIGDGVYTKLMIEARIEHILKLHVRGGDHD